ncbi:MAG: hypothetical protein JSS69_17465 [Acidobacteria bacterium]|nr:hypothetical protein [Acidobacteriota bacterium]
MLTNALRAAIHKIEASGCAVLVSEKSGGEGATKMMIILGHIGSDAGYWYIGADGKLHHVPGWNPEAMLQFDAAISVMKSATQLKTPGLAEAVVKSVLPFAQKELNTFFKGAGEGGVFVAGA